MPSSVLYNQVPRTLLYPTQYLYSIPLRVFGCTYFVHDLTLGKDKLSTKSLKCIFLGFSHLQKGYRCFSPQVQQYIVSTDVTFFETTPFYTSTILDVNLTVESLEVSPVPAQVIAFPQCPLLQYHRQVQTLIVTHTTNPQPSSLAPIAPSPTPPAPELPFAIRKDIRSSRNPNSLCFYH